MNRARLSTDPLLTTVIGLVLYVAMWLIVLPSVADTSARLAVLTLGLFTGLYCYAIAHLKGRNTPLWATFGVLAGFFELGLVPVLLLGFVRSRHMEAGSPEQGPSE